MAAGELGGAPSVNRVFLLYVTLLAGFWGGHKFLLGATREGWLYLLLCASGIPVLAALADFVELARQPPVGAGFLKRRLPKYPPQAAGEISRTAFLRLCGSALCMVAAGTMFKLIAGK